MRSSAVFMFLMTVAESRTRGPRHSQDTRVKLWHVSKDADTCGQFTVIQDASVTKPSSLCDTYEVNIRLIFRDYELSWEISGQEDK